MPTPLWVVKKHLLKVRKEGGGMGRGYKGIMISTRKVTWFEESHFYKVIEDFLRSLLHLLSTASPHPTPALFLQTWLGKVSDSVCVYYSQEARTDVLYLCFLPKCILYSSKKFVLNGASPAVVLSQECPRGQVTKDKAWEVWEFFQFQTDRNTVRSLSLAPRS